MPKTYQLTMPPFGDSTMPTLKTVVADSFAVDPDETWIIFCIDGQEVYRAHAPMVIDIDQVDSPKPKPATPKAALGRIVMVAVDPEYSNGADVAPGIITRVFDNGRVNLRIYRDREPGETCEWFTSVALYATAADLAASFNPGYGAYWPADD